MYVYILPPLVLDISSYFRAIVEKGELSQRALALTSEVISINPGNYMAWYYRRKCLDELMPDNLDNEILLLNDFAIQMAKVYQYWHHRRLILQTIGNITVLEKEFLENIYAEDDKNYHFWTYKYISIYIYIYRMWLTERFSLWEEELKWTVSELEEHPKNNSLWSYRYYIRIHTTPSPINKDFILSEIEYATTKINEDINNESAWVYLKGMFYFTPLKARSQSEDANWLRKRKMHVLEFDAVQHFCEQHIGEEGNRFSLGFMVDIYAAQDTSQSILKAKKVNIIYIYIYNIYIY